MTQNRTHRIKRDKKQIGLLCRIGSYYLIGKGNYLIGKRNRSKRIASVESVRTISLEKETDQKGNGVGLVDRKKKTFVADQKGQDPDRTSLVKSVRTITSVKETDQKGNGIGLIVFHKRVVRNGTYQIGEGNESDRSDRVVLYRIVGK
jgi:hypothetical protein